MNPKKIRMYLKTSSFIIALSIGIIACSSNKKIAADATAINRATACKDEAIKRYGNDTIFHYNSDGSFILCSKKLPDNNLNPNRLFEFFVIDNASCAIVYEDKISGALVSWYSNDDLLIVKQKGIIENDADTGKHSYTFNIKTQTRKDISNINTNQNIK